MIPRAMKTSFDPLQCGTVKYQLKGQRQLVLMHVKDIIIWLGKQNPDKPIELQQVGSLTSDLPKEKLAEFASEGLQLYQTTVAAGECIYIPSGMMIMERTLGRAYKYHIKASRFGINSCNWGHLILEFDERLLL